MTRQEKGLLAAVVVLTISVLVLGGLIGYRGLQPARDNGETGADSTDEESRAAAIIGDDTISEQEWVEELKKRYGKNTLLEMLNRKAIALEAKSRGIQVTQQEIQERLKKQMEGYVSEEAYYEEMQNQFGLSRDDLIVEAMYRISLEKIAVLGISIDDKQVDRYIKEHLDEYNSLKQMDLAWITVDNKSEAEDILDRLESGGDFAELAHTYSTDEFTRDNGGSLGWTDESDPFLPDTVMETARTLNVGESAGPVEVPDGYVIVYVRDIRTENTESPQEIRQEVRRELALQQAGPLDDLEQSLRSKYGAQITTDFPSS
ncbi:peptidylprolyl isomerase [Paenibacillus sp. P96]|uniref:peptidylprolyl isomerase n=1 Tax=Paenibacillus zeirhizosphaerae TaxID=2987519 RepID=A0ABT9FWU6_9BACL|nr:peptidylprolyl isomerase [Paenibacillus sp. P96]MDP4099201.1 peptidylprolyl isomerase [Paenibacillus sp. P96]